LSFVEYDENIIKSVLDLKGKEFKSNEEYWENVTSIYDELGKTIELGGGPKNIEKQHAKKRLTARERINLLIDAKTKFFELGTFVGFEMYQEWGGCPAGGTVAGLGRINGKLCMIIANDATVKAGSFFPMTSKKVIRAQKMAGKK